MFLDRIAGLHRRWSANSGTSIAAINAELGGVIVSPGLLHNQFLLLATDASPLDVIDVSGQYARLPEVQDASPNYIILCAESR